MADTFEKVLTLKNITLFEGASETALADFLTVAEERQYKAGEEVINNKEENHYLYIILSGSIHCTDSDGAVTELGPRQFFGETTVLCPAVIPYDIKANEATTLLRISDNRLYQMIALHPSISKGFIGELSRRIRQRNGKTF